MPNIMLPRLADRTSVKLNVSLRPELKSGLDDYLVIYRDTYQDEDVSLADLVSAMLESFLANDRGFGRVRAALKQVSRKISDPPASAGGAPLSGSPFYSNQEAAAFLRLSPRTLEKYRVIGGGPPFRKFGRRVYYTRVDLETWAARRICNSTSDPAWRDSWQLKPE